MRYLLFTMILFLMAASAWAGTRLYDFEGENPLADWTDQDRSIGTADGLPFVLQYYVENGELVTTSDNICGWAQGLWIGDNTWRNYVFEGQFRIEQTFSPPCFASWGRAVVLCAYTHLPDPGAEFDPRRMWIVWFGPHSYSNAWDNMYLGTGSSANFKFLAGSPYIMDPPVEEKRWYSFRIENQGNHYKMFLDGEIMGEFDDGSPEDAYGAVLIGSRNSEVHFDNLVIAGDSIPDMDVITGYSSIAKQAIVWGQIKASK